MANLDSKVGIIYTLSADVKDAEKEIKRFESETDKLGKSGKSGLDSLTSSTGSAGAGFLSMLNPATLAVGAVTAVATAAVSVGASLFALAKSTSDFGSLINDASEKTGLGAKSLSALKFAADQSGSSFEEAAKGITKFTLLVSDAARGNDQATESLKRLGLEPNAALKDLDASFAQVVKKIYEAKPGFEQNALAADAFGKKLGGQLIPVINTTKGEFADFVKEAERLGVTITDADAKISDQFGDTLDTVTAQISGLTREFAFGFMPAFTAGMEEISGGLSGNEKNVRQWGENLGNTLTGIIDYWKRATKAAEDYFKSSRPKDGEKSWLGTIGEYGDWSSYFRKRGEELQQQREAEQRSIDSITYKGTDYSRLRMRGDKYVADETDADALKDFGKSKKAKTEKDPTKEWSLTKVLEAMRKGTAKQESGGDPNARNKRTGASGMFQVMPDNIRDWTRDTFGAEMSPEAFKKDTQAQIAIFNKYMGSYLKKGLQMSKGDWDKAIRIAAVQWYGTGKGEGLGFDDPTRFKKDEPTRQEYTKSVLKRTRKFLTGKGEDFDYDEQEKQAQIAERLSEEDKKRREEQVKINDDASKRILDRARQTADEQSAIDKDLFARKQISEDEYEKRVEQSAIELLNKEQILLEDRLAYAKQFGVDTIDIEKEIDSVKSQIAVKQSEAETAAYLRSKKYQEDLKALRLEVARAQREVFEQDKAQQRKNLENDVDKSYGRDRLDALVVLRQFELDENARRQTEAVEEAKRERDAALLIITDKEKEKAKVDEINLLYKARLDLINQIHVADDENTNKELNPAINTEATGGGLLGILTGGLGDAAGGGVDPLNKITEQAEYMKAVYNDLRGVAQGAISSMVQGLGQLVSTWITTGKFSGKAALQMASSIITGLAIQAGIKALYELAEAYAMLANPITAPLAAGHFAAAKAYGLVAAAAGVAGVGLGLASRAFGQESATGAGNPSTGGITNGSGQGERGRGGAYSGQGDKVTTYESGANSPEVVRHEIDFTDRDGRRERWTVNMMKENVDKNGDLRDLFKKLIEE